MDIEKLIQEQKKTQKAIELLKKSKNFAELFKDIPEVELGYRDFFPNGDDPWDYEQALESNNQVAAYYINTAIESLGKAKTCLSSVKRFYEGHIKQWEEYKNEFDKGDKKQKHKWANMYSNPVCLKFFEDYEKANGITDSIFQEAKKIINYNAYHREYGKRRNRGDK